MYKVSIIIPAMNEEKRIGGTLKGYCEYFSDLKKKGEVDFEIVVVINNTTDKTEEIVKGYMEKFEEIKYIEYTQPGKALALVRGFDVAYEGDKDLIGFTDADMATPPNAFYGLIRHIKDYEGIIADRWDERSVVNPKQPLSRLVLSRGYNLIVRCLFLFNHRDTQCGAKLFKKEFLKKISPKLGSSDWNFDVDMLFYARREGARIKSIPTLWEDKEGSTVNLKTTPIKMFLSSIRLRLIHSPFRFIARVYTNLPKRLKIHSIMGWNR